MAPLSRPSSSLEESCRVFTTDALATALADRYTIERLIGEGGMARVFLARDLRHNRRVALKVLRPDLGAVVGVDRFQAEIEVTAGLRHRHGVIHRDLKPENILLHDVQPLVADFGIALAISNASGARITRTGISLGTPQYMSPEQATGDRVIDG